MLYYMRITPAPAPDTDDRRPHTLRNMQACVHCHDLMFICGHEVQAVHMLAECECVHHCADRSGLSASMYNAD